MPNRSNRRRARARRRRAENRKIEEAVATARRHAARLDQRHSVYDLLRLDGAGTLEPELVEAVRGVLEEQMLHPLTATSRRTRRGRS